MLDRLQTLFSERGNDPPHLQLAFAYCLGEGWIKFEESYVRLTRNGGLAIKAMPESKPYVSEIEGAGPNWARTLSAISHSVSC